MTERQTFAVGETIRQRHLDAVDAMSDEIASLRARVEVLEKALYPFSRAWKYWTALRNAKPECEGAQAGPKGFVIPSEFQAAHAHLTKDSDNA